MSNPLREMMVRNVLMEHQGEPVTVEHLAQFLPDNFDLGTDDLQQYQEPPTEFEGGEASSESATVESEAAAASVDAKPAKPEPPTPEVIAAAMDRRLAAEKSLANCRVRVINLTNVEKSARAKLSEAVTEFQTGFAKRTPEQVAREYVAEQQDIRRKIASGEMPTRVRGGYGKSMIDRIAAGGRGGSPARGNYRRGAYSADMQHMANTDARRGPTWKPPGEPQA